MGVIMCCTTTKHKKQNIDFTKTKIYSREAMLEEEGENSTAIFFEYDALAFCIMLNKDYFTGMIHQGFHAMSRGFEGYTETGYKSIWGSSGEDISNKAIEKFMKSKLLEYNIDLNNPKPLVLSEVGGVSNMSQPSLF